MSLLDRFFQSVRILSKFNGLKVSSKAQEFHNSSRLNNLRSARVPYPWKNLRYQREDTKYTSKIEDSDLTEENQQVLLEKRLELSQKRNEERLQILKTTEWPRHEYVPCKTQRCGLIGYKLGMMPHWTTEGKRKLVTLYQIMDNVALNYIPPNEVHNLFHTNRYYMRFRGDYPAWVKQRRWGLQFVGALIGDPAEFTAEYSGLFTKYGVDPRRKLARFMISDDAVIQPGTELSLQHFRIGDYIDVSARSTNYGFQGVMTKHKYKGGPDALGCTKSHRRPGALSHGVKVLRGKGMPGVMGNRLRTIRGLQIVRMDYKYNIIYLSGITPGPVHSYAQLYDTWLYNRVGERTQPPAMPTLYENDDEWIDWTEHNEDFVDYLHKFDNPSIMFNTVAK